ncbi:MAG: glycosyltransferase N-terminal domain-containing protein [Deltaproteobacteria bacterium]|nr:glycosyltransferase N-terminal domain-containing protein [Deltaproteobacteria bacterium]
MRVIYLIGSYLLFALLTPILLLHVKVRAGWRRRLGLYAEPILPERPSAPGRPRIWLHGASAGDLQAISPMIGELRSRLPDCTLIVSCLTNSGMLMGEQLAGVDAVTYLPWDLPGPTRRAMEAIAPDILVLEYTEVWPTLIRAARQAGAKVVLTNGRFSSRNLERYRFLFRLIGNPLREIDLFLMREDDEAERVLDLGAPLDRVWVTGNTKFDALVGRGAAPEGLAATLGLREDEPLLIAGSTHEGEEGLLLEVYGRLRERFPALRLLVAPRYLERIARVESLCREAGFEPRRRSDAGGDAAARVILLDTIGELGAAYALGTVVFVGGSFTDRGGQNILEPAACGRPVLFGPNMRNFHDAVQILQGRGGLQVQDAAHLERVIAELLAQPETLREVGELARETVAAIRGASVRNVDHMLRLLPGSRQ